MQDFFNDFLSFQTFPRNSRNEIGWLVGTSAVQPEVDREVSERKVTTKECVEDYSRFGTTGATGETAHAPSLSYSAMKSVSKSSKINEFCASWIFNCSLNSKNCLYHEITTRLLLLNQMETMQLDKQT